MIDRFQFCLNIAFKFNLRRYTTVYAFAVEVREIWACVRRTGGVSGYLESIWNYIEITSVVLSVVCIALWSHLNFDLAAGPHLRIILRAKFIIYFPFSLTSLICYLLPVFFSGAQYTTSMGAVWPVPNSDNYVR